MVGSHTNTYIYYVATSNELIAIETDAGGPATLVDMLATTERRCQRRPRALQVRANCQGVLELDGIAIAAAVRSRSGAGSRQLHWLYRHALRRQLHPYGRRRPTCRRTTSIRASEERTTPSAMPVEPTASMPIAALCTQLPADASRIDLKVPSNQPVWYLHYGHPGLYRWRRRGCSTR